MNTPAIKTKTFTVAMKEFFGFLPGQTLQEFGAEIKKLTQEDRDYFKAGLEQNGYQITN